MNLEEVMNKLLWKEVSVFLTFFCIAIVITVSLFYFGLIG